MSAADRRESLIEALGEREPEHASMDVLLQLTLPIVLILALIMAVEVSRYSSTLDALSTQAAALEERAAAAESDARTAREDLERSAAGELVKELELMVLTIQHQLLIKAADAVAERERERLALADYASTVPSARALRAGEVGPAFVRTTQEVAQMLNGVRARRRALSRLDEAVATEFTVLVGDYLAANPNMRRRERALRAIEPDNQRAYRGHLEGHLDAMRRRAFEVQLGVLTDWLQDPTALSGGSAGLAQTLWTRIQAASGAELDSLMGRFVNVKLRAALEALAAVDLELLDDVRATAIGQGTRP